MSAHIKKIHSEKIQEIKELDKKIEDCENDLEDCRIKLEKVQDDIIERKEVEYTLTRLEEKLIQFKEEKRKIMLTGASLIDRFNRIDHRTTYIDGLEALGNKNFKEQDVYKHDLLKKIKTCLYADYSHQDEDIINEDNYCDTCKKFLVSHGDDSCLQCPKCGQIVNISLTYSKPSIGDYSSDNRVHKYQRYSHLCSWIDNIQGKEKVKIPDGVIECVKKEIHRERKSDKLETLTEADIRRYLKKYKGKRYDQYYNNSTKILYMVTGIVPLQMSDEMENNLKMMFMAIQKPFEMFKTDRTNFSSYSYILYKFCQLLGCDDFLPKFRLHTDQGKIYEHDCIWKKICKYMGGAKNGWVFIKSYDY